MEELLKELRAFKCPPPDPSEFIDRSDNATMSKIMMGNQNGKGYVPTPEERERRRQTMLGVKHTPERCEEISKALKGKKHTPERNAKKSEINTGKKWFNNGKLNKFCHDCPKGFSEGMMRRKK